MLPSEAAAAKVNLFPWLFGLGLFCQGTVSCFQTLIKPLRISSTVLLMHFPLPASSDSFRESFQVIITC